MRHRSKTVVNGTKGSPLLKRDEPFACHTSCVRMSVNSQEGVYHNTMHTHMHIPQPQPQHSSTAAQSRVTAKRLLRALIALEMILLSGGVILAMVNAGWFAPPARPQFDAQQEAAHLAREAQAMLHHASQTTSSDDGQRIMALASITVLFDDAPTRRFAPINARGQTQAFSLGSDAHPDTAPLTRWISGTLLALAREGLLEDARETDVTVFFPSVMLCQLCHVEATWQTTFQQAAQNPSVFLDIWDYALTPSPALYGSAADLQEVLPF